MASLCALQLESDLKDETVNSALGSDPFSVLAGYGNDALSKFRVLPDLVVLKRSLRDAVWAEDTCAGGVDWRLFCGRGLGKMCSKIKMLVVKIKRALKHIFKPCVVK